MSESFHVSSEMTKRSWLFFLPTKIEKKMENSFLDAMKSVLGIKGEVSMFNMCVVKEKPSTLH